jgi:hypothetical protein
MHQRRLRPHGLEVSLRAACPLLIAPKAEPNNAELLSEQAKARISHYDRVLARHAWPDEGRAAHHFQSISSVLI